MSVDDLETAKQNHAFARTEWWLRPFLPCSMFGRHNILVVQAVSRLEFHADVFTDDF